MGASTCGRGTIFCFPDVIQAGGADPFYGCRICDPSQSTTDWSVAPDGTPCGSTGGVCQSGSCSTGKSDGSACYYGSDCSGGMCDDPGVGYTVRCGACLGPGENCYLGGCCNGMSCIPTTNCDPAQGAICMNGEYNPCL